MLQRQRVRDHVLRVIRVLVLVDEDVLKSLLQLSEQSWMIAHCQGRSQEKIVEIQGVILPEKLLIFRVHARDGPLIKIAGRLRISLGRLQLILSVADRGM